MISDEKQLWEEYQKRELANIQPLLAREGYELEKEQPHLLGERHLMQAVTTQSGKKLILLGRRMQDGTRVVIKATSDPDGIREIEHERVCRNVLHEIRFAYHVFFSPQELAFIKRNGYLISIQAFIEQESPFLMRPLADQFSLALKAFKAQESAHAATYEHAHRIIKTFGAIDADEYLKTFDEFMHNIHSASPEKTGLEEVLLDAQKVLSENKETIQQYAGFLTHTDFVPHNFRIVGEDIYLLDYSSLRFGNKYEGWARFLNFMTLYNQDLERALLEYVRINRTPEESLSLKLMRLYRLGEILWYYTRAQQRSSGALHTLNAARVDFWSEVLKAQLNGTELTVTILEDYKKLRDSLRSEDEKIRQRDLH